MRGLLCVKAYVLGLSVESTSGKGKVTDKDNTIPNLLEADLARVEI